MSELIDLKDRLSLRIRVLKERLEECQKRRRTTQDMYDATQVEIRSIYGQERPQLGQLVTENKLELAESRNKIALIRNQLTHRMRDMLLKLFDIYPIKEFPDRKGHSICDIFLPKIDNLEKHDDMMVSVAIGYVCHLLILISDILDVPLRSPLQHCGSKSIIYCDRQAFPLYTGSSKSRDFFYGVTLLNLNIVQLREIVGIGATKDQDETLANLHEIYKHIRSGGIIL